MNIIDKLTEQDIDQITYLRRCVVDSEHQNDLIDTRAWLHYWAKAKEYIYKFFGENFILTKRIHTTIANDELNSKMEKLIYQKDCEIFKTKLSDAINKYNDQSDLKRQFEDKDLPYCFLPVKFTDMFISWLFNSEAFVNNRYDGYNIEIKLPDGNTYNLVEGCKNMRAISKLAKYFDLYNEFEPIRLMQSQIMNEAFIDATLCLSIHPMDYITASYNDCHWRSCMEWNDGEYRRGVIEMMNSPCVIVAYLSSDHEQLQFNRHGSWNSKKWREFFIVEDRVISGIKGYPYWNRELEDEVLKWLRDIFSTEEHPYSKKIEHFSIEDDYDGYALSDLSKIRMDFICGPAMYNDFGRSKAHVIFADYLYKYDTETCTCFTIDYSGPSECVICGSVDDAFETEQDLCCDNCKPRYTCCHCGESIYDLDDMVEVNDRYYHKDCLDDIPMCDICGDEYVDLDADHSDGTEFVVARSLMPNLEVFTDHFGHPKHFYACSCCERYLDATYRFRGYNPYFCHNYDIGMTDKLPETFLNFNVVEEDDYYKYTTFDHNKLCYYDGRTVPEPTPDKSVIESKIKEISSKAAINLPTIAINQAVEYFIKNPAERTDSEIESVLKTVYSKALELSNLFSANRV